MDISEIDKMILEYKVKMEKKIPQRAKKRKSKTWIKMVGIPEYLMKFYQDEITRLEQQKLSIQNQKVYETTISWEKVMFENYQIRIKINNHFSEPYPLQDSRSSFEFIKLFILKSDLNPLLISVLGDKIVSIINIEELNFVIQILSIQDEINCYFNDFESTSIDKILSKLRNVSNQHLFDFFKLKQRSSFLSFLCEQQSTEYRIIPTTEILFINEKLVSEEDTFLFTIKNSSNNYIVWESTLINKATYVFKTNENSYLADVQRIFDFIASGQNCKRRKLRYAIKTKENPFNSIGIIQHSNIDTWKEKLKNIVQT